MTRRGGTSGDALRRIFGDGENPLGWALTLYTAWGIRVRVHIFFLLYIAFELLGSLVRDSSGIMFQSIAMFVLFGTVLLHEYGHCIACRAVKGDADDILMWPLGGLASCRPPNTWRANLVTVIGGPAVNVVLALVLGAAIVVITGNVGAVVFNYFNASEGFGLATLDEGIQPLWLIVLWYWFYVNVVLFAFNMLVPMYPMDAGRTLHAVLWARMGHRRATEVTLTVGLVAAGALTVLAIVTNQTLLIALALFGGFYCWQQKQQLRFAAVAEDPYDLAAARMSDRELRTRSEPTRADLKREKREREHRREVDRILAKIKDEGMGALTRGEKKTLARESAEQRGR